jgi:iron complex outermembrane receptor protein
VWAPEESVFHGKLLYGSSFKAPTAEQLYTAPLKDFDVRGNEDLGPQNAQTGEVVAGFDLGQWGSVILNGFVTLVDGKVEYIQRGLWLTAENAGNEVFAGAELDASVTPTERLGVRVGLGVSASLWSEKSEHDVVISAFELEQPLYPTYQAHCALEWRIPVVEVWVSPEISVVGARTASQSNALETNEAYTLPAYVYTAVAVSSPNLHLLGDRETRLTARLRDVLDDGHADPGFAGLDVPTRGFDAWLMLQQEL